MKKYGGQIHILKGEFLFPNFKLVSKDNKRIGNQKFSCLGQMAKNHLSVFCLVYIGLLRTLQATNQKQTYLSQLAENQKNKGTLLSQTLKVVEKKVPSEFRCLANWPRYGRFIYLPFSASLFWKAPHLF